MPCCGVRAYASVEGDAAAAAVSVTAEVALVVDFS